jgi:hypothetical protein
VGVLHVDANESLLDGTEAELVNELGHPVLIKRVELYFL